MRPRQPVKAGDYFDVDGVLIRVERCSRNPEKPWVDITCRRIATSTQWSKRMPLGVPATWPPVDAAGNPRLPRTDTA